jgi:hypothetical protein
MRAPLVRVLLLGLALWAGACVPPKTPMERLTDAAYDLNVATRFGRLDIAIPYVALDAQQKFARDHAAWASRIRVVDLDLVGIRPLGPDAVGVDVVISWHRLDETDIRQSQITQRWVLEKDDWRLTEEQRSGGEPGLLSGDASKAGEKPGAVKTDPAPTAMAAGAD